MQCQIAQSLIIFALVLVAGGSVAAAETYGPNYSSSYQQRHAQMNETRISKGEAAKRVASEEDMEYRALVEPQEEPRQVMQPGDVAVQMNGAKMRIKLGL